MNFVGILQDPQDMSDSELEREMKAVHSSRFDELIEDEMLTNETKRKLLAHKDKVIQEKNKRDSGEWVIPLYNFGIWNF